MKILLKQEGNDLPIAVMEVGEVYTPDKPLETLKCYGTSQLEHPGEFVFGGQEGKMGMNLLDSQAPIDGATAVDTLYCCIYMQCAAHLVSSFWLDL